MANPFSYSQGISMRKILPKIFIGLNLFAVTVTAQQENDFWYGDAYEAPRSMAKEINAEGLFTLGGDWLYWTVEQEKMEFAVNVTASLVDETFTINSDIIRPKFKEHSGYRIYADFVNPCRDWKIQAAYTHMPTSAGVRVSDNPLDVTMDFISLFNTNFPLLNIIAAATFDSVGGQWNAKINYLDIDAARIISLNDRFQITPHMGIRALWSNQKFIIDGEATDLSFVANLKGKMSGIGIEGGLWGDVCIAEGFSLVGHIGGSLIYTKFRNHGTFDGNDAGSLVHIQYNDSMYKDIAMVDSFVGLRYATRLSQVGISLHVGWEQHIIFDTNQFSVSGDGNMTLQGLTLGGGVIF